MSTTVPSTPPNATPPILPAAERWRGQALFAGTAGTALLHIERAHAGLGTWQTAHSWITASARGDISAADDTGLHFGACALAFILHAADTPNSGTTQRYQPYVTQLDAQVDALTHRRVDLAQARIKRGDLPAFGEYDLLSGLTGLGAHLLRHAAGSDALARVLTYLVQLTRPIRIDGAALPGWWTRHGPRSAHAFPGGHANLGIAHGITGPLVLLSQALRDGVTVDGHTEAIDTTCAWLDIWRQNSSAGPWWPQWIDRDELRTGRTTQPGPQRPSWCYGTPGLARAQQLAGIATGDRSRHRMAEYALTACLSDASQLDQIQDGTLCHGWAGILQTTWRAARDALTPVLRSHLPYLTAQLVRSNRLATGANTGLLEGPEGMALAIHAVSRDVMPVSRWDACLLID